ncbi:hypothetical protein [Holospora undulata]|nr:hypothetical protein [Holospora undulata]
MFGDGAPHHGNENHLSGTPMIRMNLMGALDLTGGILRTLE